MEIRVDGDTAGPPVFPSLNDCLKRFVTGWSSSVVGNDEAGGTHGGVAVECSMLCGRRQGSHCWGGCVSYSARDTSKNDKQRAVFSCASNLDPTKNFDYDSGVLYGPCVLVVLALAVVTPGVSISKLYHNEKETLWDPRTLIIL